MKTQTLTHTQQINPNTFVGLVGKVQKKPGGRREGGEKKHAQPARRGQGSNPGPAAC